MECRGRTNIEINSDEDSGIEGFPMRQWSIEVWLLDENGVKIPASMFDKVTYKLHPTFPKPTQSMNLYGLLRGT